MSGLRIPQYYRNMATWIIIWYRLGEFWCLTNLSTAGGRLTESEYISGRLPIRVEGSPARPCKPRDGISADIIRDVGLLSVSPALMTSVSYIFSRGPLLRWFWEPYFSESWLSGRFGALPSSPFFFTVNGPTAPETLPLVCPWTFLSRLFLLFESRWIFKEFSLTFCKLSNLLVWCDALEMSNFAFRCDVLCVGFVDWCFFTCEDSFLTDEYTSVLPALELAVPWDKESCNCLFVWLIWCLWLFKDFLWKELAHERFPSWCLSCSRSWPCWLLLSALSFKPIGACLILKLSSLGGNQSSKPYKFRVKVVKLWLEWTADSGILFPGNLWGRLAFRRTPDLRFVPFLLWRPIFLVSLFPRSLIHPANK